MRVSFREVMNRINELETNIKNHQKQNQDALIQKLQELEESIDDIRLKTAASKNIDFSDTSDHTTAKEHYEDYE